MGDANLLVLLDQQQRQQKSQQRPQPLQHNDADRNDEDPESPKLWTEEVPSQFTDAEDDVSQLTRATISDTVIRTLPKTGKR